MKKFFLLCMTLLFAVGQVWSFEQRDLVQGLSTEDGVRECLLSPDKWVDLPAYADREGWNKVFGNARNIFIKRGESQLDYKWQVITASMYLEFERSGNRRIMEKPNDDNSLALADLFWAELAEGEGRFMPAIIDGIFYFCEMTSWSISAHLHYQSTHRSLPDYRESPLDLVTGDYGSLFSWIWWILRDEFNKVDPVIAERLHYEIERRVITPFLENDYWWMGINARPHTVVNNWNPWCIVNVLQCLLLAEQDHDRMAQGVWRTMYIIDNYLNRVGSDGCCDEGCSYWGAAAGKVIDYLDLLYKASGGKLSLFDNSLIRSMGEYISHSYVGGHHSVNFADADPNDIPDASLVYRYGVLTHSDIMTQTGKAVVLDKYPVVGICFWRSLRHLQIRDELYADESSTIEKGTGDVWYPETEVCYIYDKSGLFFAAKGGNNNESHNHNDVGSFNLYYKTHPVLIDMGVGTYTRQTFSHERYSIWSMTSESHNVPQINGFAQHNGHEFRSRDAQYDPRHKRFSLDMAEAYPKDAGIKSWKRTYTVAPHTVTIDENYAIQDPQKPNVLHYLTADKPTITKEGVVTIPFKEGTLTLTYPASKLQATIEEVTLEDEAFKYSWNTECLWRICLTAKDIAPKGSYHVVIKVL